MNRLSNCFPKGVKIAISMSFDDGRIHDKQLVQIMNQYGIKGTFHLNSGFLDKQSYVDKKELMELYARHEVSVHTVNHPHLTQLNQIVALNEIIEDKRALEAIMHYPIRGMSYPYGDYNNDVIKVAKEAGLEYSRTVKSSLDFKLPSDFMQWHPTVHIKTDLRELWSKCLNNSFDEMRLFYVWGHSYEFEDHQTWGLIEDFCRMVGKRADVWYATTIEVKEYMDALDRLVINVDMDTIYNPSASDVWVKWNDKVVWIEKGKIVQLNESWRDNG